jgi:hypothetical protein
MGIQLTHVTLGFSDLLGGGRQEKRGLGWFLVSELKARERAWADALHELQRTGLSRRSFRSLTSQHQRVSSFARLGCSAGARRPPPKGRKKEGS